MQNDSNSIRLQELTQSDQHTLDDMDRAYELFGTARTLPGLTQNELFAFLTVIKDYDCQWCDFQLACAETGHGELDTIPRESCGKIFSQLQEIKHLQQTKIALIPASKFTFFLLTWATIAFPVFVMPFNFPRPNRPKIVNYIFRRLMNEMAFPLSWRAGNDSPFWWLLFYLFISSLGVLTWANLGIGMWSFYAYREDNFLVSAVESYIPFGLYIAFTCGVTFCYILPYQGVAPLRKVLTKNRLKLPVHVAPFTKSLSNDKDTADEKLNSKLPSSMPEEPVLMDTDAEHLFGQIMSDTQSYLDYRRSISHQNISVCVFTTVVMAFIWPLYRLANGADFLGGCCPDPQACSNLIDDLDAYTCNPEGNTIARVQVGLAIPSWFWFYMLAIFVQSTRKALNERQQFFIRLGEAIGAIHRPLKGPVHALPLNKPENVLAWFKLRNVLFKYNSGIMRRAEVAISTGLVYYLTLFVVTILMLMGTISGSGLTTTAILVTVGLSMAFLSLSLGSVTLNSLKINALSDSFYIFFLGKIADMAMERAQVRIEMTKASAERKQELGQLEATLTNSIDLCHHLNNFMKNSLDSFKILGIAVNYRFVISIITSVVISIAAYASEFVSDEIDANA